MVGFHECATKFATLVATAKGSFNLISCGRLKFGIDYSNSLATTAGNYLCQFCCSGNSFYMIVCVYCLHCTCS